MSFSYGNLYAPFHSNSVMVSMMLQELSTRLGVVSNLLKTRHSAVVTGEIRLFVTDMVNKCLVLISGEAWHTILYEEGSDESTGKQAAAPFRDRCRCL